MALRLNAAEAIYQELTNPFTKMFYHFLAYVFPKVVTFNSYFQSESVVLTSLDEKMRKTFKELLEVYMKRDYVARTKLSEIQPNREDEFLPLENMYFGVEVMKDLQKEEIFKNAIELTDFSVRCRAFMAKLCQGVQDRYAFDDPLLSSIKLLAPQEALSVKTRGTVPSLVPLCELVPRCKPDARPSNT